MEKNRKFEWTEECQAAFDELKHRLVSPPILAYSCPDGNYILDTDASDTGIGAVLSQVQDGVERVVAYSSRSLWRERRGTTAFTQAEARDEEASHHDASSDEQCCELLC